MPVRRHPRRGHTTSWDGSHSSHKLKGSGYFDSLLARDCYTLLSADAQVASFAVEPHRLSYLAPDEFGRMVKRGYVPDAVVQDVSGRILVIEVKAEVFAREPKWTRLEPYIRQAYAEDHGASFHLFTEREIRQQPRLSNAQILMSHLAPPDDEEALLIVRGLIGTRSKDPVIAEVCQRAIECGLTPQRAFTAIMRLALKGAVVLDLARPISNASLVTTAV